MQDFTDLLKITRGEEEPGTGFVYIMKSAEGTVLYVGQTIQPLPVRIRGHFHERPALIRSAATLEAEELPAEALLAAESQLIHQYHPPMNRLCPVEQCYHYVAITAVRRNMLKPVLNDAVLADTVHIALTAAREAGIDRVFSEELLAYVEANHPGHNLKPGQIRQKVTAAIGRESQVIYNAATKKMARGWYIRDQHT